MTLFIAAVAVLLMIATVLAHHLQHPADTLGLRAARREAAHACKGPDRTEAKALGNRDRRQQDHRVHAS